MQTEKYFLGFWSGLRWDGCVCVVERSLVEGGGEKGEKFFKPITEGKQK